jgi:hypothetical protein
MISCQAGWYHARITLFLSSLVFLPFEGIELNQSMKGFLVYTPFSAESAGRDAGH